MVKDTRMKVYGVDNESTKLIWALMLIQWPSARKAKIDDCLPKIVANKMREPVKRGHDIAERKFSCQASFQTFSDLSKPKIASKILDTSFYFIM